MGKTLHSDLAENCMRLERELQAAKAQIAGWVEDARIYSNNSDYWRVRVEILREEIEKAAISCSQGGTQIAKEILLKCLSCESTDYFLNEMKAKVLEDAIVRLHNDSSLLTNSDYESELGRIAAEFRANNRA